jgi:hypothetical protein
VDAPWQNGESEREDAEALEVDPHRTQGNNQRSSAVSVGARLDPLTVRVVSEIGWQNLVNPVKLGDLRTGFRRLNRWKSSFLLMKCRFPLYCGSDLRSRRLLVTLVMAESSRCDTSREVFFAENVRSGLAATAFPISRSGDLIRAQMGFDAARNVYGASESDT